ncbi:MAG: N-acetyltransferase family protein [Thermoplasmata archaeon]
MRGAPEGSPETVVPLEGAEPLAGLDPREMSSFFAPFLLHFIAENVRTGGTVMLARGPSRVDGILLRRDPERVGSIFARRRDAAVALYRSRGRLSVFSEFRLEDNAEPYPVYSAEMAGWEIPHRFAHPVRAARAADVPPVLELMREVYGRVDESWFRAPAVPEERCFLAEVAGRIAGAAWVTVVQRHGRLHSLSVAPRYRRLGIGADLWHARMMYARAAGALRVVTEIAETNVASRAIATAGGMQRIGQVFEHRPDDGARS